MVTMVVNNVTDIGWIVAAFFPGQFPVSEVINLPMMGVPSSQAGAKSLWDLYQNSPEMQKEWAQGMHLITFSASGYQFLNTKTKKLVVPEDVKGLKIRVAGANPSRFVEMLGGSPVSMPPPDMYEALDKGVIDGFCLDWMGINSFKLQDVTKYSMAMPFVSVPHGIVINQQVWDKLPSNVKAALDELGGAAGTRLFGAAFDQANESVSAEFLKLEGREITQVTDEQKAAWEAAVKPMWDGWVKAMDEKGFKGQAIIDEFRAYVAENSK
jgi:TRAP-type C4-dicarboxylate transport system substrate-binding protein